MYIGPPRTDEEFEQYFALRWRLLRAPWNAPPGSERDDREEEANHLVICDDEGRVLSAGRVHLNSAEEAQIRFMATEPTHGRQGLGSRIVAELENIARREGATSVVLNARNGAITFYERLGYSVVDRGPTMFDAVRHVKMMKAL